MFERTAGAAGPASCSFSTTGGVGTLRRPSHCFPRRWECSRRANTFGLLSEWLHASRRGSPIICGTNGTNGNGNGNGNGVVGNGKAGPAALLRSLEPEPPAFTPLDAESVRRYVAGKAHLLSRVGPVETAPGWKVKEIGDGNLNYVWMVEGPAGAIVFKQGPPHLKADPKVPLTQERARFEAESLTKAAQHAAEYVPRVYYYDPECSVIITEFLRPHVPLRGAMIAGRTLPNMPAHLASYLANVMFHTSLLSMDLDMWSREMHWFQNRDMAHWAAVTNFEHAYCDAPTNRHNSPYLDREAQAFREDVNAKVAAAALQAKFYQKQQALIHADMHTGAMLVTESSTKVFDSEFSTVGPMAFDLGTFIGNMLVTFFAADGLATPDHPRTEQASWVLEAVVELWESFQAEFLILWTNAVEQGTAGALCPPALFGPDVKGGSQALEATQTAFMEELWLEALGFAGGAIVRRILTTASIGVNDFNAIKDPAVRAVCQRRALRLGRRLLVHPDSVTSVLQLVVEANQGRQDGVQPCYPLSLDEVEVEARVAARVRSRLQPSGRPSAARQLSLQATLAER